MRGGRGPVSACNAAWACLSIYLSIYLFLQTSPSQRARAKSMTKRERGTAARRPRRPVKRGTASQADASAQIDASPNALPPMTVLTFATAAYVRWLERLHTNLRLLALPAVSMSVCAGDHTSQQAALGMRLSMLNFSLDLEHDQRVVGERFGTSRYTRIVQAKSACIHAQLISLEPSSLLWFVDGDVALFGDPRPSFLSLGVDLALMTDNIDIGNNQSCRACTRGSARACFAGRQNFNSGFFIMRSVASTRWLWRNMLSYHAIRPAVRQQVALNELIRNYENDVAGDRTPLRVEQGLREDREQAALRKLRLEMPRNHQPRKAGLVFTAERPPRPLTIAALDESRFLNGHCFYQRRPLRKHGLNSSRVLAVHHNYIPEDELKFWRARVFGAVVKNNDTTQTFLRRARTAMDTVPSWKPHRCHFAIGPSRFEGNSDHPGPCKPRSRIRQDTAALSPRHSAQRHRGGWCRVPMTGWVCLGSSDPRDADAWRRSGVIVDI